MLSQQTFDWKVPDRYVELFHFEMEIANVLQVKTHDLNDKENVTIIKTWLGREEFQFIQTLTLKKIHAKMQDCSMCQREIQATAQ